MTATELSALACAADDPPTRCAAECVWLPYPALHRASVACIPEIKAALTRQTAEEWAEESAAFAARLCQEDQPLADGIGVIHDWLRVVRRLIEAIGEDENAAIEKQGSLTCNGTGRKPKRSEVVAKDGGLSLPHPDMMSTSRIAARFSISRSLLYEACRAGTLPHYRVPAKPGARGKYLVREADVMAWLESYRVATDGRSAPSTPAPTSSGSRGGLFSELDPKKLAKAWSSS